MKTILCLVLFAWLPNLALAEAKKFDCTTNYDEILLAVSAYSKALGDQKLSDAEKAIFATTSKLMEANPTLGFEIGQGINVIDRMIAAGAIGEDIFGPVIASRYYAYCHKIGKGPDNLETILN